MSAFETYIRDLQEIRATGAAVKETSYYGALEKLLNELGNAKELKPKVRCVMQLKNIGGAGMPVLPRRMILPGFWLPMPRMQRHGLRKPIYLH
jgi:hypothetical protein